MKVQEVILKAMAGSLKWWEDDRDLNVGPAESPLYHGSDCRFLTKSTSVTGAGMEFTHLRRDLNHADSHNTRLDRIESAPNISSRITPRGQTSLPRLVGYQRPDRIAYRYCDLTLRDEAYF